MRSTRTPLVVSGLFLAAACAAQRGAGEHAELWPSNGYRLTPTWRVGDPTEAAAEDDDDEALALDGERDAPRHGHVAPSEEDALVVVTQDEAAPENAAPPSSERAQTDAAPAALAGALPSEEAGAERSGENAGNEAATGEGENEKGGDESRTPEDVAEAAQGEAALPPEANLAPAAEDAVAASGEAPFFLRTEALSGCVILSGTRPEDMRQIGTLRDLVIDPETGEIAKAILAVGEPEGLVLVPFERLFWDAGATMRLLMEADELQDATWLRWPGIEHDWSKVFEGRDLVKLGGKIEDKTILRLEAGNDLVLLRLVEENNHRHRVLLAPSRFLESVRLEKGDTVTLDAVETRDPKGRLWVASRIKVGTTDLALRDPATGETVWKAVDEIPASMSPACWPPLDDEYKLVPAHELTRNAVVYDATGEAARVSGVLFGAPFAVERYLTIHYQGREFPLPWEFVRPYEPTQPLQDQGVHVGFATSLTLALLTNMDPLPADMNDQRFWLDARAHFEELRKVKQGIQAAEALSAIEATSHP